MKESLFADMSWVILVDLVTSPAPYCIAMLTSDSHAALVSLGHSFTAWTKF